MTAVDPVLAASAIVKQGAVAAFGDELVDVDPQVRRSDRADLQADLAMGLAKRLKKPPRAIGEAIAKAIPLGDVIASVEVAGPGFINITLSDAWLAKAANAAVADARLAVPTAATAERVVIDYSAPNVAKEMHVGHLRSTIIGDALARVLAWRGHTVLRQNHLGDWGTPFGMLIEHLVDLGAEKAAEEVAMGELGKFYKEARKKFDSDEAFATRSRHRVVLLQAGDDATLGMWSTLVDLSKKYFGAVYAKLGITLGPEHIAGESFYNAKLPPLAAELEASGKATISDGALCVFPAGFLTKEKEPLPLIIRKSDGGYGYATTDLAAIRYRLDELGATRILYVVGAPQRQHFAMVFQAATELGWLKPPARAEHVMFGSVLGKDGKPYASRGEDKPLAPGEKPVSSRLVDLIDDATARADAVLQEKWPDLEPALRAELAPKIGVGAIKYADLSSDRIKDYVFDIDQMVAFTGNSAGYLQYAHARVRSIFRKAGDAPEVGPVAATLEAPERALVLELLAFGSIVQKVEATLEPHHLANYLYGVAIAYSTFFEKCPVLKAEASTRASRLALCALTGKTLSVGLDLLGIEAPDRM